MWHLFPHHHPTGGQVIDYSVAASLTTSPIWAPLLADINAWLTFAGLLVGLLLGLRRLIRDLQRGDE